MNKFTLDDTKVLNQEVEMELTKAD